MTCQRNMTKDEMIEGMQLGRRLRVDRKDAPELPELRELEAMGLVESKFVEVDEQYSYLEFKWRKP
jgi:hypothetical protein